MNVGSRGKRVIEKTGREKDGIHLEGSSSLCYVMIDG